MADHGQLINSRTYWTYTGPDGKPAVSDTPPAGPNVPLGGIVPGLSTAPASTQYQEQTYEDGTKVLSRWDPQQTQWVQESVTVDPGLRGQSKDTAAAATAAAKAEADADKPIEVGGKLVKKNAAGGYDVVWSPEQGGPKPIEIGGRIVQQQADGSYKVLYEPPVAKKARTAPDLNLGAPRPGQRTNLALVQAQYKLFADQLAADPNVTPEQYTQRLQAYIATNVTPAIQRATDEVNAEAARQQKRQEEADARAARAETRQLSTEERIARTGERSAALAEAKFGYDAGQDAVSNALKLLPYQANPAFAGQFAAALSNAPSGRVSFTADAFRVPLPDVTALAEQGAQRAAAAYAANRVPYAGGPAPTPVGGPAGPLPSPSAAGTVLANAAVAPPPPVPVDPRLLQGPAGPGSLPQS